MGELLTINIQQSRQCTGHILRWTSTRSTFTPITVSMETQFTDLMALVRGDSDRQDLEKRCWRPAGQTPSMEDIPRIKKISKTFYQNCYFLNDDGILCVTIGM